MINKVTLYKNNDEFMEYRKALFLKIKKFFRNIPLSCNLIMGKDFLVLVVPNAKYKIMYEVNMDPDYLIYTEIRPLVYNNHLVHITDEVEGITHYWVIIKKKKSDLVMEYVASFISDTNGLIEVPNHNNFYQKVCSVSNLEEIWNGLKDLKEGQDLEHWTGRLKQATHSVKLIHRP